MNILLFISVLVTLVIVHEFGHFLMAKMFNIKVEEFGIGYPPLAIKLGKIGETLFTLNWLPFGGFVKIVGEESLSNLTDAEKKRALVTQPRWKQAIVLVGGVLFNFLFAFIIFTISYMFGAPMQVTENSVVDSNGTNILVSNVQKNSPASFAGLKSGDRILKLTYGKDELNNVLPSKIVSFIKKHPGDDLSLTYKRDGVEFTTNVMPTHGIIKDKENTPAIGISMTLISAKKQTLISSIINGWDKTVKVTYLIANSMYQFVLSIFDGTANWSTVAGPIGIVNLVGDASNLGLIHLMNFVAIISINLVIINLLPIPALDGGRVAFLLVEGIIRRNINSNIANLLNILGFVGIILLMILVTYHDIVKLFF